jgi:hypothetical protein
MKVITYMMKVITYMMKVITYMMKVITYLMKVITYMNFNKIGIIYKDSLLFQIDHESLGFTSHNPLMLYREHIAMITPI